MEHLGEPLGVFYLGKRHDLAAGKVSDDAILYDARDLTTHGVCVGMTGSGKTGLCLALLEEALLDGVPVIAIDPKGDLGNLALTFPNLAPTDFAPWVDPAQAQREGITVDELAARTATRWRDGLAGWQQGPDRIARLRAAGEVVIYTPGSTAGRPLSVLRSFAAPAAELAGDAEAWRGAIEAAVSGLLALIGVDADPMRSREHVLLSTILDHSWRAGRDLDLAGLIQQTMKPGFTQVGAFDLDTFFPAKERSELALALNTLLASPSFAAWAEGEPLDVARLLYGEDGRPRIAVLSIAHLSDAERMFFVTLLLQQVVAWMRTQAGTSSLRALLFMDEVFGFLPPTAAPPSKKPMLTLLKQARAFGLGVVLATQNPVDLDYKALSNAGTWWLGRLQTERDKAWVLDGLEGATAAAGRAFDRAAMEQTLSALTSRVFVMNNVHDDAPVVMQTRWVMSYLAGPMTRAQLQRLAGKAPSAAAGSPAASAEAPSRLAPSAPPPTPSAPATAAVKPMAPGGLHELFTPPPTGVDGALRPTLLGTARIHFVAAKQDVDTWRDVTVAAPIDASSAGDFWERGVAVSRASLGVTDAAPGAARYQPLPRTLDGKAAGKLEASLAAWAYRTQTLTLWTAPSLKLTSRAGEAEADFRARCALAQRERRDAALDKLETRYQPKIDRLQARQRAAEDRLGREQAEASATSTQSAISVGASVLGALFGRRVASRGNVTRAASAARSVSRASRQRADVARAGDTVEAVKAEIAALQDEIRGEVAAVDTVAEVVITPVELKPRKADTAVTQVALWWRP